MAKHLLLVESPAKSKTLKKYLGKDYQILATYGHVRDLEPKSGSVDPKNNFHMKYVPIERNLKHVQAIAKAIKNADDLFLATDPDREGEAISWHICEWLREQGLIKDKPVKRVTFYEITKTAVTEAIKNAHEISMDLVNAQQARRALDYLVGFNLSPLLWRKIRRGLSAGRVQSPALRMIVERELEIEAFDPKEYWTVHAEAQADKQDFSAKLAQYQGEKVEQFTITNEEHAKQVEATLIKAAGGELLVDKVEKKQRKRNPTAPFITSTLQQEAARKLGFTARRTMRIAQQLYEGVDIGTGTVGLITYMRTDSVNLANEAITEIRELIEKQYGKDFLPDEVRTYKTKSKNAQEAHDAIRPTSVKQTPKLIKEYLSAEQLKLYDLIWKRAVACQMIHALIDTVAADLLAGEGNRFRANGSTIHHPGFMTVYLEGEDDTKKDDADGNTLPTLTEGDRIKVTSIHGDQHFTEPPPRYSEASLVKALEEHGIGRPSTYASIIETLQNREYVVLETKRFYPTDVGRVVNRFLTEHFTQYVDYSFTANLEDELDAVSRGEQEWVPLLEKFWLPFVAQVKKIDETVQRSDVTSEDIDETCPDCSKPLQIKLGRSGRFIACTGFPECKYTRNIGEDDKADAELVADRKCPDCKHDLVVRHGRYGKFIGCSNYPDCKHIEPLEKPQDTEIQCPRCKQGTMLKRKSRRGKIFFSCSRYPDCDYAVWNEPLNEACPSCNWPMLTLKVTKKAGANKWCPQDDCDFKESVDSDE